jgi:glucokinase
VCRDFSPPAPPLVLSPRGGVYVAGGIAPKILPRLAAGGFLAAFSAKGAFSDLARAMPVHVVIDERLGLLGAARLAETS